MEKNNLLYISLIVLGFLATGVLVIILAPDVWWIGLITISVAIVVTLWALSIYLIPKKS